ncbi:MAG: rod shape-determining protein MreC [Burkholderiaceae bacterium]
MLDRSPPALFKQGITAFVKLAICTGLSAALMLVDRHAKVSEPLRAALATALHPVQYVLRQPLELAGSLFDYFQHQSTIVSEQTALKQSVLELSLQAQRAAYLNAENQRLEELLQLRSAQTQPSIAARVVAETPDPYAARVVIDKGSMDGVRAGAAVVDANGVYGQVTTVYPLSSEVTLVTDSNHATPVMNARTGVRGVLFGAKKGTVSMLEMRYVNANADVQSGDLLITSGIDGVYPPGLHVATVNPLPDTQDMNYTTLYCTPSARVNITRGVLVVSPAQPTEPPQPAVTKQEKAGDS